jgi:hypothetical protein
VQRDRLLAFPADGGVVEAEPGGRLAGHDQARHDGVHPDPGRQLEGEALGHDHQACFGRAGVHAVATAANAGRGADVQDDAAVVLNEHQSGGVLGAQERAFEVHVEDGVPVGFGHLQEGPVDDAGGVVH